MPFIVFEGLDGSGKSTLIKGLADHLTQKGIPVTRTREPGGTPIGEKVRRILLDNSRAEDVPSPWTELLLYEACRRQNVEQIIRPALKEGHWVLCDRYWASTSAFQAGGRGLDEKKVTQLNQWAIDGLNPDLWVYLDLSLKEAQRRWEDRTSFSPLDRFELEEISFHQRVLDFYKKITQDSTYGPWLTLQASQSREELIEALMKDLVKREWIKG